MIENLSAKNLKNFFELQKNLGIEEILLEDFAQKEQFLNNIKKITTKEKPPSEPIKIEHATTSSIKKASEPKFSGAMLSQKIVAGLSSLEELKQAVLHFKELAICKTATNTVFCDGNPNAKIMLIGEAPGSTEDEQGIPFCGDSGRLLRKLFAYAEFNEREDIYISNTVFWRPPGNRKPSDEEIAVCKPFVEKHIALIKPEILIAIGGTAASLLIPQKMGITKLRGKYFEYQNEFLAEPIKATALFHPSYLLRNPSKKQTFFFDLLKIRKQNGF